VRYFRTFFHNY